MLGAYRLQNITRETLENDICNTTYNDITYYIIPIVNVVYMHNK